MKKTFKKILSAMLSLAMVFSLMTIVSHNNVYADTSTNPASQDFIKAFHLDCGRKYFSVSDIETIIDTMAENKYNTLELAVGNDGLRLLLDDMSLTVNGTTYTSAEVTAAIQAGNKKYSDQGTNELTQTEMTSIIAYAKEKGITIIPLVNTPGHMDAILSAATSLTGTNCAYSGSSRTIDVTNSTATAFTQALLQKYIKYFAGQGCKYFNMGCDEYANDISSGPQFAGLISAGKYSYFVTYVNDVAKMVEDAGMTPIAFNDGIYYNQNTSGGTFDTNIIISYWSSGWSGYSPASASYLQNKGFKILNTNGNWYYVLNAANGTSFSTAKSNLQSTAYNSVQGSSGTMSVVGCMVCYWCDTPSYTYTTTEAGYVQTMLSTFAEANNATGEPFSYDVEVITTDEKNDGSTSTDIKTTTTINLVAGGDATTKTISGNNYSGNVDDTKLDESIATVTVTGKDAVVGTGTVYNKVDNATVATLGVTATSYTKTNYYYTPDNGANYYPVYARQRQSNASQYYWGYSTTDDSNNVTAVGSKVSSTTSISVYTKSDASSTTPASTTITFTPVSAGTTYVTVGDTEYTIVVAKGSETLTMTAGNTTTYTDTTASTAKSSNTSVVTVSYSGDTLTLNAVAEGTATVTTTNCTYNVTVSAVDLTNVTTTIEFWVTNRQVTANSATSMTLNAGTSTIYSENGAAIADLVPTEGSYSTDTMVYWKATRLASSNKQTTDSGVDKTLAGTDFTRIRYYNGSWAYYNGTTWTNVASGDQLVAYYLQKTTVTDEVTTEVVDWGPVKANWGDLNYLSNKYVLLDYTVKYESGEESPSSFTNAKTLAFHCDVSTQKNGTYYRTIGMTKAEETSDYEVYMITCTPTSDSTSTVLASYASSNGTISYNGTEKVIWAQTQSDLDNSGLDTWTSISGTYTYSIGGEPIVPGMEIYRQQGMKITYYVRAKVTEDSLTVKYVNEATGETFYDYNIAVNSGTTFNSNIALSSGKVVNGTVTNSLGKTQTVSSDLSTMPAIGTSYRYSDYTCTKLEKSEDSKTVTLYYNFNNTHSFVIDFGLPVEITSTDLGLDTSVSWNNATVTDVTYGSTKVDPETKTITYTPNEVLKGVEQLSLTLTEGTDKVSHIIYVYPATTVYYEEGFATLSGFTTEGTSNGTYQTAQLAGSSDNYGYDANVAKEAVGASNGTQATSTTYNSSAIFSFTGTGVDIYANSDTTTEKLSVVIRNTDTNALVKFAIVNTVMANGSTVTKDQAVTAYNVPVYSITNLPHGNYTVYVGHYKPSNDATETAVHIDGFRVYNTLASEPDFYEADLEDSPSFIELRNQVIVAYNKNATGTEQVYKSNDTATDATVTVTSNTANYSAATVNDLLTNGPKNEIYLQKGQAVTFEVTTARKVELGMKALNASTSYTISGDGNTATTNSTTLTSSTDMFYTVVNKASDGKATTSTVTITNNGDGILSITKLKVSDDATLNPLTEEDIEAAIEAMNAPVVVEPVVEYGDATLTVAVNNQTTALVANGVVGESYTFTAEAIKEAATALVEDGYELNATYSDVTVAYGEADTVTFTATKKAQPKQTFWQKVQNVFNQIKKWFGR